MNRQTAQKIELDEEDNPQDNLKLFMMEESFSNRWGSRIAVVADGRETCATTRNVVRSNKTTSSAPKTSAKDFKCASMSSVFGIRTLTIVDHALCLIKTDKKKEKEKKKKSKGKQKTQ